MTEQPLLDPGPVASAAAGVRRGEANEERAMQSFRLHLYRIRSPSSILASLLRESTASDLRALAHAAPFSSPVSAPSRFFAGAASRHFSFGSGGCKDSTWDKAWNAGAGGPPAEPGEAGSSRGQGVVLDLGWGLASSWSTGLMEEHFDRKAVGQRTEPWEGAVKVRQEEPEEGVLEEMERGGHGAFLLLVLLLLWH